MPVISARSTATPLEREIWGMGGQSNMEGRGQQIPVFWDAGRVKRYINGVWEAGQEPTHPGSMCSPGMAFGTTLATLRPNKQIGLVPFAYGGSSMDDWARSTNPLTLYGNAVIKMRAALREGTAGGLIWYQGESDTMGNLALAQAHAGKFLSFVSNFRTDVGVADLRVIFTVLCANPSLGSTPYWDTVVAGQEAISLTSTLQRVTAQDLPVRQDAAEQRVHLATEGCLVLGQRLAVIANSMMPA